MMAEHPFHCGCDDEICVAQRNATEFDLYAEDEVIFFRFLGVVTARWPHYHEWRTAIVNNQKELGWASPLELADSR